MPELSLKSDLFSDHDTSDDRKVEGLHWQQIALELNASSFVLQITPDYEKQETSLLQRKLRLYITSHWDALQMSHIYNIGQIKFQISSITWAPLVSTSTTTNADLSAWIAQQASPVALPKQLQAMYRVPWRVKTLWKTPESQEDWRRCERLILLSKFLSRRPWLQVVSARSLQVSTWSLLSPQKAAYSPKQ